MFALVDCNNFYCACERLFDPRLRGRPLIVLSNNDGCIISRTTEAKALGLPMTAPLHQVNDIVRRHGVVVRSSNYELYQDMSDRVMRTLETLSPHVEVYSIDEAFVDVGSSIYSNHSNYSKVSSYSRASSSSRRYEQFGKEIKQRVEQWVGLPVCVGIAANKTLAKLANHAAKKYPATQGVVDLSDPDRVRRLLEITPVQSIWGIGSKQSAALRSLGVLTASDLAQYSPKRLRKRFSVVLARTQQELQGDVCSRLALQAEPRKHILCSRAFGQKQYELNDIKAALAFHVHRAAAKLRKDGSLSGHIKVSLKTNPFALQDPQYIARQARSITPPTNDTGLLLKQADEILSAIYKPGFPYHKVGITLSELSSDSQNQLWFRGQNKAGNRQRLMQLIDNINRGKSTQIAPASTLKKRANWQMRRQHLSPAYTTKWSDLPVAKCD